jgi:hypothetical protein
MAAPPKTQDNQSTTASTTAHTNASAPEPSVSFSQPPAPAQPAPATTPAPAAEEKQGNFIFALLFFVAYASVSQYLSIVEHVHMVQAHSRILAPLQTAMWESGHYSLPTSLIAYCSKERMAKELRDLSLIYHPDKNSERARNDVSQRISNFKQMAKKHNPSQRMSDIYSLRV